MRRHWLHSESWWPRLLRGQPAIAWDDYEKDYSDLPREARATHILFGPHQTNIQGMWAVIAGETAPCSMLFSVTRSDVRAGAYLLCTAVCEQRELMPMCTRCRPPWVHTVAFHVDFANTGKQETGSHLSRVRHVPCMQVLAQHAAVEAARSDIQRLEARERDVREVLQVHPEP